jgi:hypothetical protein
LHIDFGHTLLQLFSPSICEQLLRKFPFEKKLQTQTESRVTLGQTLLYEKASRKMLVKLTRSTYLLGQQCRFVFSRRYSSLFLQL